MMTAQEALAAAAAALALHQFDVKLQAAADLAHVLTGLTAAGIPSHPVRQHEAAHTACRL